MPKLRQSWLKCRGDHGRGGAGAGSILLLVLAIVLAACSGSSPSSHSSSHTAAPVKNATVTYAEQPGAPPNYIFPVTPAAFCSLANYDDLFYMMYRPLYWWGVGDKAGVDYKLSLATQPQFSNGGKTVTIHLKHYLWSDGDPVTSRDLLFWLNMVRASETSFCNAIPGELPFNIASARAVDPSTFQITFDKSYSREWILGNELSLFIPLPQQVWDRTSPSGPVGNLDTTMAGAKKVFGFLNNQSMDLHTYSTNPLWRVVDGPWKLQSLTTTGEVTFVPNPKYSGPRNGDVGKFVELPFTTNAAEYNALRSGTVDYGYIPASDAQQVSTVKASGYDVKPWLLWSIAYELINYGNSTAGPLFHQLYVRQALQHLINEPQIIKEIWRGYAVPTNGPVPTTPLTKLAGPVERKTQYPYDLSAARSLLAGHGWKPGSTGVLECARPGTGPGDCGTGIPAGKKLELSLLTYSGVPEVAAEVESFKSNAQRAGILINIREAPANTVASEVVRCDKSTGTGCNWQLAINGSPSDIFVPPTYPTGDPTFKTGAPFNYGSYSNAKNDALIGETDRITGLGPMYQYQAFLARQLPVLWVPDPAYQISAISTRLHGAGAQSIYGAITPEDWYLSR